MFIKSASITDFRNVEQASVEFAPFTVIRGHNHQGKTSLRQAIELSLTSRTQGTDAQGRGANDKIRVGAKKARIDLVLRGKTGDMPLGVTYGPNKTGRQMVTDNPVPFMNWLQNNNERLSCVLDSEYFIRQKPEDQKSIVASLVLPTTFDFPREIREQVALTLRRADVRWDHSPLQVIEDLYDTAFEQRKQANAALRAVHIPELPAKPAHTVDQINAKLAELRGRLAKLPAQSNGGDSALELGRLIGQKQGVEERLHAAEEEAAAIRISITETEADVLTGASLKTHQGIAFKRKTYNNLEAQAQEIARQIDDQNNVISIYTDLLEDKKCPTCTQAITEEWVNGKVQEVRKTIANMGAKQREIMTQQKELGDISESEKLITAHDAATTDMVRLRSALAEEVSKISKAKEDLRALQLQIDAAPKAQAAPVDNTELTNLNAMIARVEGELTPAIRYEGIVAEIQTATARKVELEKKVAALEKLVHYFGKDGVKATLIQENISAFEQTVNSVLRVWGYEATLNFEPYEFIVNSQKSKLPLKELSGSEALMFGVALQTAIAVHSRIGTVVVDKADTFISHERLRLMSCLDKLVHDKVLEQAIVMVSDERTEVPQKDGVAFYAAQEGKLVRL